MLAFGYMGETEVMSLWPAFSASLFSWLFIVYEVYSGDASVIANNLAAGKARQWLLEKEQRRADREETQKELMRKLKNMSKTLVTDEEIAEKNRLMAALLQLQQDDMIHSTTGAPTSTAGTRTTSSSELEDINYDDFTPPVAVQAFDSLRKILLFGWSLYPLRPVFSRYVWNHDEHSDISLQTQQERMNGLYNLGDLINKVFFGIAVYSVAGSLEQEELQRVFRVRKLENTILKKWFRELKQAGIVGKKYRGHCLKEWLGLEEDGGGSFSTALWTTATSMDGNPRGLKSDSLFASEEQKRMKESGYREVVVKNIPPALAIKLSQQRKRYEQQRFFSHIYSGQEEHLQGGGRGEKNGLLGPPLPLSLDFLKLEPRRRVVEKVEIHQLGRRGAAVATPHPINAASYNFPAQNYAAASWTTSGGRGPPTRPVTTFFSATTSKLISSAPPTPWRMIGGHANPPASVAFSQEPPMLLHHDHLPGAITGLSNMNAPEHAASTSVAARSVLPSDMNVTSLPPAQAAGIPGPGENPLYEGRGHTVPPVVRFADRGRSGGKKSATRTGTATTSISPSRTEADLQGGSLMSQLHDWSCRPLPQEQPPLVQNKKVGQKVYASASASASPGAGEHENDTTSRGLQQPNEFSFAEQGVTDIKS
ncbi:unnamed protein product [Amoebophrya sp. A120]|nr:unnamed protein product [Amoebophrya sp. A120]|eukprot:GSA120T00021039001.1